MGQFLESINLFVEKVLTVEVLFSVLKGAAYLVIIIAGAKLLLKSGFILIDRAFMPHKEAKFDAGRMDTLRTLMRSVLSYTVYFIVTITVLQGVFHLPVSSILATAGIFGLAVGFGAQSLVRDVISGFFILLEDHYRVGDYVTVGDASGIVEETGLRITKIKEFDGTLHIIPNGSIDVVANHSRANGRAWVDVSVAYEEDIDNVLRVLEEVGAELKEERSDVVEGPDVLGVSRLGESDVVISIIARTYPMQKWAVERELRKRIKQRFDHEGIEIPYPRRVVIGGTQKGDGHDIEE